MINRPLFQPDSHQDTPRPLSVSPRDGHKKTGISITYSQNGRSEETNARAWARREGIAVPATGRVSAAVLDAYRRAGSPSVPPPSCSEPDCDNPAKSFRTPALCQVCYQRCKRRGSLPGMRQRQEQSPLWKGERIGYAGAHERVNTAHGRASEYVCNCCAAQATDWALMPDTEALHTDGATGQAYSPDPGDYRPMCRPCHSRMDGLWRAADRSRAMDTLPGVDWPTAARPVVTRHPLRPYQMGGPS